MKYLHRFSSLVLSIFLSSPIWALFPIDTTEMFTLAPGCDYMAIRWQLDDGTGINSFILRVDASNPSVSFQERSGQDRLIGRERLTSMVQRFNEPLGTNPVCIAAVNGDFFWMENEAQENGLVRGFTICNNEFERVPEERRLLGGITEDKKGLVGTIGEWTGTATLGGQVLPLARINYHRLENELVLYNQYNDRTTCTDSLGTELLLELLPNQVWHSNCTLQARVIQTEQNKGNMTIPRGGLVLSGNGTMAQALNTARIGDLVTITTTFTLDGVPTNFNQCIGSDQYAQILKDGIVETKNFWPDKHPRNGFGYTTSRDTLFFVLVDGRIPESMGCTTSELGEIMRQIGCYNATNWDGGRSAHLWLRGRGFMNKGCDNGHERAISNGMFILYRTEHPINHELDSLLQADPSRAGGNYHGYEFHDIRYTPAPKGYKAFYLSHYGRHGSRSRHSDAPYKELFDWLRKAEQSNNLTGTGKQLLLLTEQLLSQYNNMPSRLTDRGEREHTRLAARMYERTPEIFKNGSQQIRAISSQSPRCLVSMASCTNQLARMNPNLRFNLDCGKEIQKVISPASDDKIKQCERTIDSLSALLPDDTIEVYKRLFMRPKEAQDIPARALQDAIYETVVTAQCFDLMDNIYLYLPAISVYRREVMMAWRLWVPYGNNDLQTQMRRPGVQVAMNDFIRKANEAIQGGSYCADLRFGHDTQLLSILAGMNISGIGEKMTPEEIEKRWYNYREFPMALNLQLIFYQPKKKALNECADEEILVKVLYNEEEHQIIGLKPVYGCYYRWSDVKTHWSQITNHKS